MMAMAGEGIGRREREAVRVTVETSPLRGLPIPVCKIQCIAVAKREESGPSWLYLGTDNGHLLLYCLSSSPSPSSSSTVVSGGGGGGGVVSGFSPVPRSSSSSLQDLELGSSSPSIQSGSSGVKPGKGVGNADPGSDSGAGSLNSSNGIAASPSPQRRSQTLGSGSPIPSPSVGSYAASSRSGTNMVLTKRRIMGKTAIESLCALPEVGRIALFFDGQILLLDMRTLGSLERLPATKGASALARAMFSSNAVASLGSMAVSPSKPLLESEEEEVVVDRAIVPAKPPSKIGGLGALVGRGSSATGDTSKTTTTTGLVGKLGEAFSRRASLLEGSAMPKDANRVPSTQGESLGKLAIAVRKKLLVYEVHAVETPQPERNGEEERRVRVGWDDSVTVSAFKVREMVCMEGIVTMTWLKNVIIAGTLQEYILFSLSSGQATVLFSLPQDLPWPPLLKLFPKDLEVLLVIDNVGILVNTEGQPTAGSLLFSVVPDAIGQTPPYVVVVKQGRVELHHRKTGGKVQSLDFTTTGNGRFLVADDDAGTFVVIANATKVWCLQQVPLDEQLRDLLKQRQISEAVRLAEESVADGGGDVAKERLAVVHAEAGFLLLFDLQFEEAMDHFLQSDVFQPSELFPFFPSFTSRWRNLLPRKRYWGLHPPPQSIQTVIESGLLAVQSGLLVLANAGNDLDLLARGPSSKSALADHFLLSAMRSFARYLSIARDKEMKPGVKEGVDTLLLKLYAQLENTEQLKLLTASPNSCVLEEVETTLKAAAQLHPLALLYESKGLYTSALEVWRTLALNDFQGFSSSQTSRTGLSMKAVEPQQMVAEEAARLLEASSDSSLVLQHVGWILRLDQGLALRVLTSSKRSQPLPPGDVLTFLDDDGGLVRQRYLQWLVQEQGSEDTLYHTELAISLAKAALDTRLTCASGEAHEKGATLQTSDAPNEIAHADEGSSFRKEHNKKITQKHQLPPADAMGVLPRAASMNHGVIREMLQTFLAASDKYDAEAVLASIQESELWREHVILYKKLGDEMAALRTLALKLEDSEAAEHYCAELGRPEVYMQLLDMYLKPGEGREPMHGAAVRLLHCHGASLDPLQVLEALSADMPLPLASQTIARMMRARVHRHRQGQIVKNLERHINLEARVSRVEERSRHVCITNETACANCRARIGTKLFALYPNDCVVCYKCSRLFGEQICPVTGQDFEKDPISRPPLYLTRSNSTLT